MKIRTLNKLLNDFPIYVIISINDESCSQHDIQLLKQSLKFNRSKYQVLILNGDSFIMNDLMKPLGILKLKNISSFDKSEWEKMLLNNSLIGFSTLESTEIVKPRFTIGIISPFNLPFKFPTRIYQKFHKSIIDLNKIKQ